MRFHKTTLSDVIGQLPPLATAESVEKSGLPQFDLCVAVNGFEDRTAAVPKWLAQRHIRVATTLLLHYPSNIEDNRRTVDDLEEALSVCSERVIHVEFGIAAPKLRNELQEIAEACAADDVVRILLDISGASGRIILRVLRSLFELQRSSRLQVILTIAYAEAGEYAPTHREARALIEASRKPGESTLGLDFDAEEVSPSVEYPGQHIEHVPDRAVVVCGFNADRARAALDHIDTAFNIDVPHSRVTYIAGRPPRKKDEWRLTAMMDIHSSVEGNSEMDFHVTSTLNYAETLQRLESCYQDAFGHERLTVLPFGSKMQTVATALFCEMRSDVKAQLLGPARYAGRSYSHGVGQIYLLHLGSLQDISSLLSSVGQLTEVQ
ncbi:hypothetical protein [Microcella pacifica]|uniref:Uncharacterized protein n=1 Tax=Microcella pacifica TaxID=2591847 RepID=A0A9E5JN41_9MICO|nr:hypothetical protein [Microcella pacifica]NHF62487.1 hypothetical protein [Microcella pacifica]